MKIILASSSPNRKELFDRLGIAYEIIKPDYEEHINPDISPEAQIQEFALGKAQSVGRINRSTEQPNNEDYLIMGFDSMIGF